MIELPGDLEALEAHVDLARLVADQRRRQALIELGRHQQRDLHVEVLDQQAEEVAELVHRHADVLTEEVAAVVAARFVAVDQRIVVGAVHLDLDLARHQVDAVEDRAGVLRQAAQRVAILDRRVAAVLVAPVELVADHARAVDQLEHQARGEDLAAVRLVPMDEGMERLVGAAQRLDVERVGGERDRGQRARVVDAVRGDAGHHRGAVDHRQAFLGPGLERLEAEPSERGQAVDGLAAVVDHEVGRQPADRAHDLGERREIAAGADRAELTQDRRDALVEEHGEAADELEAQPRGAAQMRVGAQQHRRAHVVECAADGRRRRS